MSSKKNKEELTNRDFFISGTPSNKINTINQGVKKTPPARIQAPSNKVIKRKMIPEKQTVKRTPTPKQSIKRTPTPKQSIKRTPTPKKQTVKRTPTPIKQTVKRTQTPTKQSIKRTPTPTNQTVKREKGQTKPKFSLKIKTKFKTKSKTKTKTKMNNDKKNTILITNGLSKINIGSFKLLSKD